MIARSRCAGRCGDSSSLWRPTVPRPKPWLASCLALAALPVVAGAQGKRQAIALSDTMGSFPFVDAHGSVDRPITVWYYRPRPRVLRAVLSRGRGRVRQHDRLRWPAAAEAPVGTLCS
jgi:hypothetical protein